MKIVFALLIYSSSGAWPVDITLYAKDKDCNTAETKFNAQWAPNYIAHCAIMQVR